MMLELRPFDSAQYLDNAEEMAAYLQDALASGDEGVFTDALGAVARAKGMTQLAKDTGLSRPTLYRSLSAGGKPEWGTVMKVLKVFGLTLTTIPLPHT